VVAGGGDSALDWVLEFCGKARSLALVHPREVFVPVIEESAAAIILVHNHPSGSPEPSRQDIAITREIAAAAGKLGIVLHDHIVVGGSDYRSMRGMGLL